MYVYGPIVLSHVWQALNLGIPLLKPVEEVRVVAHLVVPTSALDVVRVSTWPRR